MKAFDFLSGLLVEEFGVSLDRIEPSATPADLGLDSLTMMEIIAEIENEFAIKFTADHLSFTTLGEVATLADKLIHIQAP